jgi:hypothetical protein
MFDAWLKSRRILEGEGMRTFRLSYIVTDHVNYDKYRDVF